MTKKLFLSACLCLSLFIAHAQHIDTAKTADSVYVPLKYCDIHKRSPVLACLLSVYIPGLGQVYNKQGLKAGIVFGTFALSFGAAEIYHSSHTINPYNTAHRPNDAVTAALLLPMAAAYIYAVIDAPVTANWLNKTYHLAKKKRSLAAFNLQPGIINSSPDHFTVGLNLVLR
ncbi:DUF5683 domain-containing protein [Mucilaginibacter ginsenosidivorans]|uniref:DUF5683 domain-containing protein n=1 Tax=Mucilaginibacter ginsenosidivorans TaxID=398053 RepID=A0A5B8V397_9SPHI|nr:DUF5683 domain-containing protein [Mucilaginibacter ginsenosidivorans]QEC65036.1 hypothetical protein FRZ54_21500 [Mucilaginibacter ginsenosidivorans]